MWSSRRRGSSGPNRCSNRNGSSPDRWSSPTAPRARSKTGFLDVFDKIVVDTWSHAHAGPFGALRHHVDSGALTRETLHAEIGQIVNGDRPGRESDAETILFWHRGQAISDIALAAMLVAKARHDGVGTVLPY